MSATIPKRAIARDRELEFSGGDVSSQAGADGTVMGHKKIGEILVELRVLTEVEVERVLLALRRRGGRGGAAKFGQVAREMGLLRDEHVLAALAVQLELIPGAGDLTLSRLLRRLCDPATPPPAPPRRPRTPRPRSV